MLKISLNQWIIISQISWMSLFVGTGTHADLWHTGSARIAALPVGSTDEPVDSWTASGMQEGGLLSVSRSTTSPISAWVVLSVIE